MRPSAAAPSSACSSLGTSCTARSAGTRCVGGRGGGIEGDGVVGCGRSGCVVLQRRVGGWGGVAEEGGALILRLSCLECFAPQRFGFGERGWGGPWVSCVRISCLECVPQGSRCHRHSLVIPL